jgi:peptide/nickel transport system permease protein
VTGLTFVLASLAPGDAVQAVLADQTNPSSEQYQQVRHQLGLDRSLPDQYWHWVTQLFHGSLGNDLFSGESITQSLNLRIGASLSLILTTLIVSTFIGVGLGVTSAVRGGVLAKALDALTVLGFAVPNFWLGVVLIELLAVKVRLFPATGYIAFAANPAQWAQSLVLPVMTLAVATSALIARQTRESMLRELAKGYITSLRAHGLPLRSIVLKHALRNAAIPVVTVLGVAFIGLLGGTVIAENIFAIPGIGQAAVSAGANHDLPMIEGIAFYFAVIVIIVNLVVDLSYRVLNPRARQTV